MKVIVQWSNGAILPVLTKPTSKVSELISLLRFACMPNEDFTLFKSGIPLNPETTLESQNVNENDILEAFITHIPIYKPYEKSSNVKSIILEAAKVSDKRFNTMEKEPYLFEPIKETSSDDDEESFEFVDYRQDIINSDNSTLPPKEPLPPFWNMTKARPYVSLNSFLPPKLNSVEEVGQFLEKNGWSSWMW